MDDPGGYRDHRADGAALWVQAHGVGDIDLFAGVEK
jgi:hypothetical protein